MSLSPQEGGVEGASPSASSQGREISRACSVSPAVREAGGNDV